MPVFGIASNMLRFAAVYTFKSSIGTPGLKGIKDDGFITLFESGPAPSDLFSVTAAVSWLQIAEYLYLAGAYDGRKRMSQRAIM